ncbi:MAG: hypothetical protein KIS76_03015 [Pyrinomonadaceae bacterium]|nr:hypothetical protein [Pyrinomonadaceae bacterium]
MPKLSITGYQTGFQKAALVKLLQEELDLDREQSVKMSDAVTSGNVISLDFADEGDVEELAEKLTVAGATVKIGDAI